MELIKKNLTLAHDLIFVSHYVKKRFDELFFGLTEQINTWIVYNPVDSAMFPTLTKKEARGRINANYQTPIVLFVGSLIPRKGAKTLIEAVSQLKQTRKDLNVLIIGEGSQKSELERLIYEKDIETKISILGSIPQQDLTNYYNAADLFVLPSVSESFGLVFIEAMLCGCPIVGSPDVLLELLPSKEYGYHVPLDDLENLARTIDIALNKTWDRERIRNYALKFDWKSSINKFEDIYMKAIQDQPRQS